MHTSISDCSAPAVQEAMQRAARAEAKSALLEEKLNRLMQQLQNPPSPQCKSALEVQADDAASVFSSSEQRFRQKAVFRHQLLLNSAQELRRVYEKARLEEENVLLRQAMFFDN